MALPDLGGLELIHSLPGFHKDLPLSVVSGAFNRGFLRVATALGAAGTLNKPP